jgi:hypothetical protein
MKNLKLNKKILGLIVLIFCLSFFKISLVKSQTQVTIPNPVRHTTFEDLLKAVLEFLQGVGAVIAVISLMAGAFTFISAGGNPEKVNQGYKMIFWTIIGLFVIISASAFIELLKQRFGVSQNP